MAFKTRPTYLLCTLLLACWMSADAQAEKIDEVLTKMKVEPDFVETLSPDEYVCMLLNPQTSEDDKLQFIKALKASSHLATIAKRLLEFGSAHAEKIQEALLKEIIVAM